MKVIKCAGAGPFENPGQQNGVMLPSPDHNAANKAYPRSGLSAP